VIHGIDLSSTFFPHIQSPRNQNIHLSVCSCTSLPEDWTNSFSLVNQSLLIGALSQEEWRQNLLETYRILKPGGQVQLFDPDLQRLESRPGTACEKMRFIIKSLWETHSLVFDFEAQVIHMLTEIGFENVQTEVKEAPLGKHKSEAGTMGADWLYRGFDSMQPVILRHSGFGIVNSSAEYQSLLAELQREWDEGIPWAEYILVSAQKPFTA